MQAGCSYEKRKLEKGSAGEKSENCKKKQKTGNPDNKTSSADRENPNRDSSNAAYTVILSEDSEDEAEDSAKNVKLMPKENENCFGFSELNAQKLITLPTLTLFQSKLPDYISEFFPKFKAPPPNTELLATIDVSNVVVGVLKGFFASKLLDVNFSITVPKGQLGVDTPDIDFSVWMDHLNNNYTINQVPHNVFSVKFCNPSRFLARSLKNSRYILRSLLVSADHLLKCNKTNDLSSSEFLNETIFKPIAVEMSQYLSVVRELRLRFLPFKLKSCINLIKAPLSKGSLWTIPEKEIEQLTKLFFRSATASSNRGKRGSFRGSRQRSFRYGRNFRNYRRKAIKTENNQSSSSSK